MRETGFDGLFVVMIVVIVVMIVVIERNWFWWLVCGDDCDLYWQPTPVQLHVNRSAKYGNNEQNEEWGV